MTSAIAIIFRYFHYFYLFILIFHIFFARFVFSMCSFSTPFMFMSSPIEWLRN